MFYKKEYYVLLNTSYYISFAVFMSFKLCTTWLDCLVHDRNGEKCLKYRGIIFDPQDALLSKANSLKLSSPNVARCIVPITWFNYHISYNLYVLKPRKISFVLSIRFSFEIVLEFCREHSRDTARFEFKMSFGGILYHTPPGWHPLPVVMWYLWFANVYCFSISFCF